jgi:hypothetical protein
LAICVLIDWASVGPGGTRLATAAAGEQERVAIVAAAVASAIEACRRCIVPIIQG